MGKRSRLRSRPAHRYRNQERLPSLRRFPVTPVTATVIPCATCAALVPGTVTQPGGGKPSAYPVLVPATTAAGTPGQQTPVVTATAVAGNPTSPVTYTGAASSISAKGAV